MSDTFQRNEAGILGNSDLTSVSNSALALKNTLEEFPSNGQAMQEKRISSAEASGAQADRTSAKQGTDSWTDDTWDTLLSSDQDSIRMYMECRLSELSVRKRDNDKTVSRLQEFLDDSLMKDLGDFKHRVMNEERIGPLREYFLEQCLIFERYMQQPSHKPSTNSQEPTVEKLKVSDLHQSKIVVKEDEAVKSQEIKDDHNKDGAVKSQEIKVDHNKDGAVKSQEIKDDHNKDGAVKSHETKVDNNKDGAVKLHETKVDPNKDGDVNSLETKAASNRDKVVNTHEIHPRPNTDARSHDTEITDQPVETRSGQTSGGTLVTAPLTVGDYVEELHKTSTGNKVKPLADHQDLPTAAGKELADNVCRNIGQEWTVTGDARCNQNPANTIQEATRDPATNIQDGATRHPATNIQIGVTRKPAPNTQDRVTRDLATNIQDRVTRDLDTNIQDRVTRDLATNIQDGVTKDPATNTQGEAPRNPDTNITEEATRDPSTTTHEEATRDPATNAQEEATWDPATNAKGEATRDQERSSQENAARAKANVQEDVHMSYTMANSQQTVHQTEAAPDSIDLLLIGSCGNGKSATGNSILGKVVFPRSASSSVAAASSTSSIRMASTDIAGQLVTVVDGPSINVCGNITPEELDKVTHNILRALELCKFAFNALVIVLKFGNRFTKQETEALRVIKAVLGGDVIREFGVCVITFGDSFDVAVEESREDGEELTFDSWMNDQTGEVRKLLEECGFRCVLFDNVTKDGRKRKKQLETLMRILPIGKRYTQNAFLAACEGTNQLQVEANLPRFLKETWTEAEKLKERIEKAEETKNQDPEAHKLSSELWELKAKIDTETVKSGELESLKLFLQLLESQLSSKIKRWRFERNMDKNAGVQVKTLVNALITPPMKQQTPAIGGISSKRVGRQLDSENLMPLEILESTSKTSCRSSQGIHAISFSGLMQDSPNINTTTEATRYLENTQVKGQCTRSHVSIDNCQIVDGNPPAGDNAPFAEIIKKRVIDFVNVLKR